MRLFFFTHHITELSTFSPLQTVAHCPCYTEAVPKSWSFFLWYFPHSYTYYTVFVSPNYPQKGKAPNLYAAQVAAVLPVQFPNAAHMSWARSSRALVISVTKTFLSCVWLCVHYIKGGSNYFMKCSFRSWSIDFVRLETKRQPRLSCDWSRANRFLTPGCTSVSRLHQDILLLHLKSTGHLHVFNFRNRKSPVDGWQRSQLKAFSKVKKSCWRYPGLKHICLNQMTGVISICSAGRFFVPLICIKFTTVCPLKKCLHPYSWHTFYRAQFNKNMTQRWMRGDAFVPADWKKPLSHDFLVTGWSAGKLQYVKTWGLTW